MDTLSNKQISLMDKHRVGQLLIGHYAIRSICLFNIASRRLLFRVGEDPGRPFQIPGTTAFRIDECLKPSPHLHDF